MTRTAPHRGGALSRRRARYSTVVVPGHIVGTIGSFWAQRTIQVTKVLRALRSGSRFAGARGQQGDRSHVGAELVPTQQRGAHIAPAALFTPAARSDALSWRLLYEPFTWRVRAGAGVLLALWRGELIRLRQLRPSSLVGLSSLVRLRRGDTSRRGRVLLCLHGRPLRPP